MKYLLMLLICTVCHEAFAQQAPLTVPSSLLAKPSQETEQDVNIQVWMEGGQPRMKLEGLEGAPSQFDEFVTKAFAGNSEQEYLSANWYLHIDKNVNYGSFAEMQFWLGRLHRFRHFVAVKTLQGTGCLEMLGIPSDHATDSLLCLHYLGAYIPAMKFSDLNLKTEPTLEEIDLPPPPQVGTRVERTIYEVMFEERTTIHVRMDATGQLTRKGKPLERKAFSQLLQDNPQAMNSAFFVIEVDEATPFHKFTSLFELMELHPTKRVVLSSAHYAILQRVHKQKL
jgi:biopolymer transport protein ExbD